jgi:hypothetical protein
LLFLLALAVLGQRVVRKSSATVPDHPSQGAARLAWQKYLPSATRSARGGVEARRRT